MIHAYHVVFGAYGFWLPNDPRGSWSDFVGAVELVRFGKSTRTIDRRELTEAERLAQQQAKQALKYTAVSFDGPQARAVGIGIAEAALKGQLTIWACSILPEHVHLVIARHVHSVERIVNLLKGAATKALLREKLHPLSGHSRPDGRPPSPWARGEWTSYLDSNRAIEDAICYVEENPMKEGKPRQKWSFVTPFGGLPQGGWVTYH